MDCSHLVIAFLPKLSNLLVMTDELLLPLPENFGRPPAPHAAFQSKDIQCDTFDGWSIHDGFYFTASFSNSSRVGYKCCHPNREFYMYSTRNAQLQ